MNWWTWIAGWGERFGDAVRTDGDSAADAASRRIEAELDHGENGIKRGGTILVRVCRGDTLDFRRSRLYRVTVTLQPNAALVE